MDCQFVKVWQVTSSDGYTSKPVAYFSSRTQAEVWLQPQKDNVYLNISTNVLEGIQVGNKTWLLGRAIDLDCAEEHERERLINSAKNKLSPEELAAILGK